MIKKDEIIDIVNWLKKYGEFDNKIFIITADHGHTAMADPSQMTFTQIKRDENGNIIGQKTWEGDASCKLNVKGFNKDKNLYPELANNNLHIWELAEVFRFIGKEVGLDYKILAPEEIAKLFKNKSEPELPYGATAKLDLIQACHEAFW